MASVESAEGRQENLEALAPHTLAKLHVAAMRYHERAAALVSQIEGKWHETPDWRLDRQVIRLALFLQDRAALRPGDRLAIVSSLRREFLIADLAALLQGACAFSIDPGLPDAALAAAFAQIAPRVIFISDPALVNRVPPVNDGSPDPRLVVAFDGPASDVAILWADALDLGGTLDTPERAQALRAHARALRGDADALGEAVQTAGGSISIRTLRDSDAAARVRAAWARAPARAGDVAYVSGGRATLGARLAALSFVADGKTSTVLGTPGRDLVEISETRPHKIVAPGAVLEAAVQAAPPARRRESAIRTWLGSRLLRKSAVAERERERGSRMRWVQPTGEFSAASLDSLRRIIAVEREL